MNAMSDLGAGKTSDLDRHTRVERSVPEAVRRQVLERDRHQCQVCGRVERLELHHWRDFRSQGGGHTEDNLVTLCFEDHAAVHARHLEVMLYFVNERWCTFWKLRS